MGKELKRFIRDGVSETLKQEKAFDEELYLIDDRVGLLFRCTLLYKLY
ncbi:hypothetical protein ABNF65_08800 [Paenibacillus larvae]